MAAFPNVVFTDSVGSSETGFKGIGMQDQDRAERATDRAVTPGPDSCMVIDEDDRRRPAPAQIGRLAAAAPCRSATTRTRRSRPRRSSRSTASATRCPATSPRIEEDGTVTLLGRGTNASTPAARRSTPRRSRWRSRRTPTCTTCWWSASPTRGSASAVAAVVQLARRRRPSELEELAGYLRAQLSGYKLPRARLAGRSVERPAQGRHGKAQRTRRQAKAKRRGRCSRETDQLSERRA